MKITADKQGILLLGSQMTRFINSKLETSNWKLWDEDILWLLRLGDVVNTRPGHVCAQQSLISTLKKPSSASGLLRSARRLNISLHKGDGSDTAGQLPGSIHTLR